MKYLKTIFAIWAIWAVICLGLAGTALYVAFHFISKFW